MAAFVIFRAAPASADVKLYCVTDEVVPILDAPGGAYEIDEFDVYGDGVTGIIVYGNRVWCEPAGGKFKNSWRRLASGESGLETIGFVPAKGLEPAPGMRSFAGADFLVRSDAPQLLLMPGKQGGRYDLAKYDFQLIKGDAVRVVGETDVNGEAWALIEFGTSIEDGGGSGVGMRYAWIKTSDITPLAKYRPDNTRADPEWFPSRARNYLESGVLNEEEPNDWNLKSAGVPEAALGLLGGRGFWINPNAPPVTEYTAADDMADLYAGTGEYSVDFITTDIYFHAFHMIFDSMLENVETTYLASALKRALASALDELERIKPSVVKSSGESEESYLRAYYTLLTPYALILDVTSNENYSRELNGELGRIVAAAGREQSYITGAMTDYTQYRPRGHYTKSPELMAYFRAMTWLGEAGLQLFDGNGDAIARNVRATSLIVLAFDAAGDEWKNFDGPIDFLVGKSGKGAFAEYRELVKREVGSVANIADDARIASLASAIKSEIAPPRIRDGATGAISREEEAATRMPEFRISGKRFTFDAYVFNQLTSPRVGSDENPRNLPSGTDVTSALGSDAADKYAKSGAENYSKNLAILKREWPKWAGDDETVHSFWLRSIADSFADSGSKQFFYRSGAWGFKKLLTASASWAELKHDTILYGEQSGAEKGDGGFYAGKFQPPLPRGYVEPDPQTYAALSRMAGRLLEFFAQFGFERPGDGMEYTDKLTRFRELCGAAEEIARKEIKDEALSPRDYARIKELARAWNTGLLRPGGFDLRNDDDPDINKMALIADVATDFVGNRALYAATGAPRELLVYVNDRSGGPRIARGYVYSYYEFDRPLSGGRMNDPEWRRIVYRGGMSDAALRGLHPAWYGEIYPDWK
jgi:hypothetical protein